MKKGEKKTEILNVRLPHAEFSRLEQRVKRDFESRSEIVRQALRIDNANAFIVKMLDARLLDALERGLVRHLAKRQQSH